MSDPGHAAYERACDHDRHGREAEAIPHYREALERGLGPETRPMALLGLGSSLRNVGEHAEAVRVLRGAVAEAPEDAALAAFLALAEVSAGETPRAVGRLLDLVLTHAPLHGYDRALRHYREEEFPA